MNQRPLGYEGNSSRHTSLDGATSTKTTVLLTPTTYPTQHHFGSVHPQDVHSHQCAALQSACRNRLNLSTTRRGGGETQATPARRSDRSTSAAHPRWSPPGSARGPRAAARCPAAAFARHQPAAPPAPGRVRSPLRAEPDDPSVDRELLALPGGRRRVEHRDDVHPRIPQCDFHGVIEKLHSRRRGRLLAHAPTIEPSSRAADKVGEPARRRCHRFPTIAASTRSGTAARLSSIRGASVRVSKRAGVARYSRRNHRFDRGRR